MRKRYPRYPSRSYQSGSQIGTGCIAIFVFILGIGLLGGIIGTVTADRQAPHSIVVTPPGGIYPNYLTPNASGHGTPTTNDPYAPVYPLSPVPPGNVVICRDGWVSHSGGKRGACSHHGGERR